MRVPTSQEMILTIIRGSSRNNNTEACVCIKSGVAVTRVPRRKGTRRSKQSVNKRELRLSRGRVTGKVVDLGGGSKETVSRQSGPVVTLTAPVVKGTEMNVSKETVRLLISATLKAEVTGRRAPVQLVGLKEDALKIVDRDIGNTPARRVSQCPPFAHRLSGNCVLAVSGT